MDLSARIADLEALDTPALRRRWREVIGADPPAFSRAELLRLGIAYRLQEQAFGGLPAAVQRQLARLALQHRRNPGAAATAPARLKPGTRLVRRWGGTVHQVTVLDRGFQYRGEAYASLSGIARSITGTRWSGPAFFGLTAWRVPRSRP